MRSSGAEFWPRKRRYTGAPRAMRRRMEGFAMRKMLGLAIGLSALILSACNTVEGAGRDVSAVGHAVTQTARDVAR
jgi:predicted small secreted protein